jgi:hypothetical protein
LSTAWFGEKCAAPPSLVLSVTGKVPGAPSLLSTLPLPLLFPGLSTLAGPLGEETTLNDEAVPTRRSRVHKPGLVFERPHGAHGVCEFFDFSAHDAGKHSTVPVRHWMLPPASTSAEGTMGPYVLTLSAMGPTVTTAPWSDTLNSCPPTTTNTPEAAVVSDDAVATADPPNAVKAAEEYAGTGLERAGASACQRTAWACTYSQPRVHTHTCWVRYTGFSACGTVARTTNTYVAVQRPDARRPASSRSILGGVVP